MHGSFKTHRYRDKWEAVRDPFEAAREDAQDAPRGPQPVSQPSAKSVSVSIGRHINGVPMRMSRWVEFRKETVAAIKQRGFYLRNRDLIEDSTYRSAETSLKWVKGEPSARYDADFTDDANYDGLEADLLRIADSYEQWGVFVGIGTSKILTTV